MKQVLILLLLTVSVAYGQQKKPVTPEVMTFTTLLAGRGSGDWHKGYVQRLIDSPLVVKDQKGRSYPVAKFTLQYTLTSVYVDSQTKQRKERKDFRMQTFEGAVLSQDWIASIKENVQTGDKIVFNTIMIRQPNGKLRLAPELTINAK
jgi:hypothetical protein